MPNMKKVPKFTGVYTSESTVHKWHGRPDKCFYIAFKDKESGKLHRVKCGWASEGWTAAAAQNRRHEILDQARVGDYKPKADREVDKLTFGELMEKHYLPWADDNKQRARDDRSMYRNWLRPALADKTLPSVSAIEVERLKKTMKDAGKAPATVRHALCLVRQAFNKSVEWRLYAGANPCKGVKFPQPDNQKKRFLTREQAADLMVELEKMSPQVRRITQMSLETGMRLSEVLKLRWKDIDRESEVIHVRDRKNAQGGHAYITAPVASVLDELTPGAPEETLFVTNQGKPVVWLSKSFAKAVDALGLNDGVTDRRDRITFHSVRHTFASWRVQEGVPLYSVGTLLGHKTLTMTGRYSHLDKETLRKAAEAGVKEPIGRDDDNNVRKLKEQA